MDETDEVVHTRCVSINYWSMRPRKDHPYQSIYKTTVDRWDHWRTTYTRWWTKQLLMVESDEAINARWCTKQLLMDEADEVIHTRWCTNKLSMDETNEGPPKPEIYKTTVYRWERRNPYQMMCESTVNWWDHWRTTYTRWYTKQLLMDESDEWVLARWYTNPPFTDETNGGLPIPGDVQNNCWWMREMKESMPDDVRNNCWWMRPRQHASR